MSEPRSVSAEPSVVAEVAEKMLGALVTENLYWDFKKAAALRKEDMRVAIRHAALMYIDAGPKERSET